jgi:signal transduction histidine kinase
MKPQTELRLLVVAIVMLMVEVFGSLVLLSRASTSLSAAEKVVLDNAAPTIVALDAAQARLREVHALVLERPLTPKEDLPWRDASIAAARQQLEQTIASYFALPTDPGEGSLQSAIKEAQIHLDRTLDHALALERDALRDPSLRAELDQTVARLGLDLFRASEFSVDLATASATSVARTSHRLLPTAAAIEVLAFLAAAATLALTYRAVRRARDMSAATSAMLARRAEELELFAGRVAHDLLSPLMTVSLAIDLARRRASAAADDDAGRALGRGAQTLQRVRAFVSDLLEFARAGARPVPGSRASVADVVHEVSEEFAPIAHDAGVDLRIEDPLSRRAVACSPGVLTSVLSNLVQNAIKYIGEGDARRVSIRAVDGPDRVLVEVNDTGPGVCPADRDHLFEPYARGRDAKAPGIGLGLATVKRLVEAHGGQVGMQQPGASGSVFWFALPAAEARLDTLV